MSWIKFSGRRLDGAYPCLALANSTCQCSSWSKNLRSGMVRNGGMSWMNVNPGFFSWWGSPAVIIWYLNGTLMKQPWKLGQTSRGKNTQGPWWMIAYIYIHITRMASTMTMKRTRHDKNSRYSDNSSILRYYRVYCYYYCCYCYSRLRSAAGITCNKAQVVLSMKPAATTEGTDWMCH